MHTYDVEYLGEAKVKCWIFLNILSIIFIGYQDLPLDEPMPILPANTGERPPPLFKGISSKSLSSLGFQSYRHSLRMNAKRFSVVEQNDKGNACMSTKMIKIAVSGKAGRNGRVYNLY